MNISGSTIRSAPSACARARAARALAALPVTSPTVGFNWASVILNWAAGSVMGQWCLARGQTAIACFRPRLCVRRWRAARTGPPSPHADRRRTQLLKSRCHGHRLDLAATLLLQQLGDQERHVDRLLGIEPG